MRQLTKKVTHVTTKNHFQILVYLIIAVLITPLSGLSGVKAAFPHVFVNPPYQTIDAVRNVFAANVCISDVFNLYGYEFKLYYNSTALNGSSVIGGPFLEESGQTPFFQPVAFTDHYNSTYGIVWVASALTGSVLGVDGDGVLATIEFNATALGNLIPLSLRDVKLSDPNHNPIPYVSSDGTVTVLSEFTWTTAILTLILISIPVLFVARRTRRTPRYETRSGH